MLSRKPVSALIVSDWAYDSGFQQGVGIRSFCENFVHVQKGILSGFGTLGEVIDLGLVGYVLWSRPKCRYATKWWRTFE